MRPLAATAGSMQTMFRNSPSPISAIPALFSTQGFQTTTSVKPDVATVTCGRDDAPFVCNAINGGRLHSEGWAKAKTVRGEDGQDDGWGGEGRGGGRPG